MSKYTPNSIAELRQIPYAQSTASSGKAGQNDNKLLESLNTLQMKIDSLEKDVRDIKTMMVNSQIIMHQRNERLPTYGTQPAIASAPSNYTRPKFFNP